MKIALIGRYGESDILPGPERVAREFYLQLKKKNIDVTFIEYFFSGYSDYSLFNKVFGKKIKNDNVLQLGIIPLIVKLLKEQFDIIHFVNSQRFSLVIFFLKPFLKARFICTLHGLNKAEVKNSKLKRAFLDLWIEKISLKKSKILIFPSNFLFNLFKKNYNFYEDKCKIIHNGIGEVFYENQTLSFRRRGQGAVKSNEKKIYNFVYYNSFNKGLKELLNEIPVTFDLPFRIFVIGKEEKIENLNKNIEVNFVPPMTRPSLLEFLSDKHFIIKSSVSDFDAFPTIAIECMSMGIIPVVSEKTGIKEIIKNNINGFIFGNGNESLSSLLEKIIEDKFNLIEISRNASKIYEKLNWGIVSEQYIQLYNSLV
jgi:glycosyltransferase involved in cell wall biosynthesis